MRTTLILALLLLSNQFLQADSIPEIVERSKSAIVEIVPSLIAARDKAVTAAKRKQLQKETAQIPNHVAKMRR
jgi:hypothetical protein